MGFPPDVAQYPHGQPVNPLERGAISVGNFPLWRWDAPAGLQLIRYYGWYSHRQRGIRTKAQTYSESEPDDIVIDRSAPDAQKPTSSGPRPGSVSTWAMLLIKRVYEVDPLECPQCGGQMKIISVTERNQSQMIERILRHCGLWEGPLRTLATARAPPPSLARPQPTSWSSSPMASF